ncbi:3'-5' DNA helicase [Blastocladiella emersonii ATCC 22665]|nr:3'-5' DNA helicase [Blastocladiella emersonii ATCC 22665]
MSDDDGFWDDVNWDRVVIPATAAAPAPPQPRPRPPPPRPPTAAVPAPYQQQQFYGPGRPPPPQQQPQNGFQQPPRPPPHAQQQQQQPYARPPSWQQQQQPPQLPARPPEPPAQLSGPVQPWGASSSYRPQPMPNQGPPAGPSGPGVRPPPQQNAWQPPPPAGPGAPTGSWQQQPGPPPGAGPAAQPPGRPPVGNAARPPPARQPGPRPAGVSKSYPSVATMFAAAPPRPPVQQQQPFPPAQPPPPQPLPQATPCPPQRPRQQHQSTLFDSVRPQPPPPQLQQRPPPAPAAAAGAAAPMAGAPIDDADTRISGVPQHYSNEDLLRTATVMHPFDAGAISTWLYPTNKPVRDYQFNIVQKALFRNTLVSIPTGMGKTLIAAVVMVNYYRWFPEGKIVFLAPTRPLVSQQQKACTGITGIPPEDQIVFVGTEHSPADRVHLWRERRVFFATPQIMQNDLERGVYPGTDVVLVVIDEAHRATGNYASVNVVRDLLGSNARFRVLALSATPGSKREQVQDVVSNLHIDHIEIRTEELVDLRPYTFRRNVEPITVPMSGLAQEVRRRFGTFALPMIQRLRATRALHTDDFDSMAPYAIHSARERYMKQCGGFHPSHYDFMALHKLVSLNDLLVSQSVRVFYQDLARLPEDLRSGTVKPNKTLTNLVMSATFKEFLAWLRAAVLDDPQFVAHPKQEWVERLVLEHFTNHEEAQEEQQRRPDNTAPVTSSKVMIFAKLRSVVEELTQILARHSPLIRPTSFVGQSKAKSGERGLNQREQLGIIKRFQAGGHNVLVSTSVGEEGLDIGEVDLIICYDASQSPIQMLQRMGRTGRKREGRVVCLLAAGREENAYRKSQNQYKSVQSIIQNTRELTFAKDVPRMLPAIVKPVCVQMRFNIPPPPDEDDDGKSGRRGARRTILGPFLTSDEMIDYLHRFAASRAEPALPKLSLSAHIDKQVLRFGHRIGPSATSRALMELFETVGEIDKMHGGDALLLSQAAHADGGGAGAAPWDDGPTSPHRRSRNRPAEEVEEPPLTQISLPDELDLDAVFAKKLATQQQAPKRPPVRPEEIPELRPIPDSPPSSPIEMIDLGIQPPPSHRPPAARQAAVVDVDVDDDVQVVVDLCEADLAGFDDMDDDDDDDDVWVVEPAAPAPPLRPAAESRPALAPAQPAAVSKSVAPVDDSCVISIDIDDFDDFDFDPGEAAPPTPRGPPTPRAPAPPAPAISSATLVRTRAPPLASQQPIPPAAVEFGPPILDHALPSYLTGVSLDPLAATAPLTAGPPLTQRLPLIGALAHLPLPVVPPSALLAQAAAAAQAQSTPPSLPPSPGPAGSASLPPLWAVEAMAREREFAAAMSQPSPAESVAGSQEMEEDDIVDVTVVRRPVSSTPARKSRADSIDLIAPTPPPPPPHALSTPQQHPLRQQQQVPATPLESPAPAAAAAPDSAASSAASTPAPRPAGARRRPGQPAREVITIDDTPPPSMAPFISPERITTPIVNRKRLRRIRRAGDPAAAAVLVHRQTVSDSEASPKPKKRRRRDPAAALAGILDLEADISDDGRGGHTDDYDSDDSAGSLNDWIDERSATQISPAGSGASQQRPDITPNSRIAFYRGVHARDEDEDDLHQLPAFLLRGRARVVVPSPSVSRRKRVRSGRDAVPSSAEPSGTGDEDRYDSEDSFIASDEDGDGGESGVDATQSLEDLEEQLEHARRRERKKGRLRKRARHDSPPPPPSADDSPASSAPPSRDRTRMLIPPSPSRPTTAPSQFKAPAPRRRSRQP